MLYVYIHDCLLKRKLTASANTFMNEGKVATDPIDLDMQQLMHQEGSTLNGGMFVGHIHCKDK
ncbi:hypothetical protein RchiOBHm_Chr3g0465211 [Rosa chinensis]|uniref:Uncharacterized protein n=1 Tax=Rosa chinensis TaxID=74649 RepID=A0A2P6R9N2_ROSCH|nr:hypothetical protein RchiOBHm_Chr3g0465211 [Rosa chinensis]